MAETLFISDLHLDAGRPEGIAAALHLLEGRARSAHALYILGDLWEYWVGDDDPAEPLAPVIDALLGLRNAGVPTFFVHGNRDFLIGPRFAERSGVELLPDPCVIELAGTPTVLSHGDHMCTDDVDHMAFRSMVLDPAWQERMLQQPLAARHGMAQAMRAQSVEATAHKGETIMDVNAEAVRACLKEHQARRLIHGHTHRPGIHYLQDPQAPTTDPLQRVVLGDWYARGNLLSVTDRTLRLEFFPLN